MDCAWPAGSLGDDRVVEADMQGLAVYDVAPELVRRVEAIAKETDKI